MSIFASPTNWDPNASKVTNGPVVGSRAPDFTLLDQAGRPLQLAKLLGKRTVVLFFFVDGESPECVAEACAFRDAYDEFWGKGAEVIGISPDAPAVHAKFSRRFMIQYPILADPSNMLRHALGIKNAYFDSQPGRCTVVIDHTGIIRHVYNSQVSALEHVEETRKALYVL